MQCLGSKNSNNGVRNVNLHNIPTMSQLGTIAEDKDAREKKTFLKVVVHYVRQILVLLLSRLPRRIVISDKGIFQVTNNVHT